MIRRYEKVREEILIKINQLLDCYKQETDITKAFRELNDELALAHTFRGFYDIYKENPCKVEDFINYCINKVFTENRIIISENLFYKNFFNKNVSQVNLHCDDSKNMRKVIKDIIVNKIDEDSLSFYNTNIKEINSNKYKWILYFKSGVSFNRVIFDFKLINSITLRNEFKMYMKYYFKNYDGFKRNIAFKNFVVFFNEVVKYNEEIRYFKDLNIEDVKKFAYSIRNGHILDEKGKKYSISSQTTIISALKTYNDYLVNLKDYKYKPTTNYFEYIKYNNANNMGKKTEVIPDNILQSIIEHKEELGFYYEIVFDILLATGMRSKEVTLLKLGCVEKYNDEFYKLIYTPFKTLNARKRNNLSSIDFVLIEKALGEKILKFIEDNKKVIEKSNSGYIFVRYKNKGSINYLKDNEKNIVQLSGNSLCVKVNKIINKYKICTLDGEIWNYTNKQLRKTMAVDLASNGASSIEIAAQLGHLHTSTTETYYAEVNSMKLANLNAEFFKEKFELKVSEEILKPYSEEERKQLYVDFALNSRDVELGQCTKHFSEGVCGLRTGEFDCSTCPKLCTGVNYIDKWTELYNSKQSDLNELLKAYKQAGIDIEVYEDFVEYKQTQKGLNRYKSVLDAINGGGDKNVR